jgi:hypothetical protein
MEEWTLGARGRGQGRTTIALLGVNLAGPSPDGFPERASQLGRKPRCALKSAGAPIASPSLRPIRSSSHQGLGEPKITGPGWEHIAITRGIKQIELSPAVIPAAIFRGKGLPPKPRCVLKSTDPEIPIPSPRSRNLGATGQRPWSTPCRLNA